LLAHVVSVEVYSPLFENPVHDVAEVDDFYRDVFLAADGFEFLENGGFAYPWYPCDYYLGGQGRVTVRART